MGAVLRASQLRQLRLGKHEFARGNLQHRDSGCGIKPALGLAQDDEVGGGVSSVMDEVTAGRIRHGRRYMRAVWAH
jgi:hypothetical protein